MAADESVVKNDGSGNASVPPAPQVQQNDMQVVIPNNKSMLSNNYHRMASTIRIFNSSKDTRKELDNVIIDI